METLIKINKSEEKGILIFEFSWELDETNADKTFKSIYEQIWEFENKKMYISDTENKSSFGSRTVISNLENLEFEKNKSRFHIFTK